MTENQISKDILEACIKVHSSLGPGLLESAYEDCLEYELREKMNHQVKRQCPIPLVYDGKELGEGFRADLIIDDKVIIELKSVKELQPIHYSQVITYLRLTGIKLGILVNFSCMKVSKDFHRIALGLQEVEQ